MENMGEVSVIIPFYNAESCIKTCIKSLKDQTYPYFKAYFVDDGSTDSSVDILEKYMDHRFVLVQQEKRGVSAARNLGMERSGGDYLAFMDVDDEVVPDYLEKLIAAAQIHHVDVVMCNYAKQYANGRIETVLLPWANTIISHNEIQEKLIPLMIFGDRQNESIMGAVWRTFINKNFWERTAIRFQEDIFVAEDLLFLFMLFNRTEMIYALQDCLYIYKQSALSTVNKFKSNDIENNIKLHKALKKLLKESNSFDSNYIRYQASVFTGITFALSNLARNPDLKDSYRKIRCLRKYQRSIPADYKSNEYLYLRRKILLWMLEHKMYLLLLLLCKIKERFRMREFFSCLII